MREQRHLRILAAPPGSRPAVPSPQTDRTMSTPASTLEGPT